MRRIGFAVVLAVMCLVPRAAEMVCSSMRIGGGDELRGEQTHDTR